MPLLGKFGTASARAWGFGGGRIGIPLTISSNSYNYDVYTNRGPTYVAGSSDILLTINTGVTVGSTSPSTYALLVPSAFSPTDTVTIINNGLVQGRGGNGGNGGTGAGAAGGPGGTGGNAIYVNRPTIITNNNTVAYGGGGGGGSGGVVGGPIKAPAPYGGGGGGGGAGFNGGSAGSGGTGPSGPGAPGSAGTSPAGGGGGASGSPSRVGPGGAGGGRGAAGSAGGAAAPGYSAPPGPGGAAGNYIVGNPFVTWPATGTRQGNVA